MFGLQTLPGKGSIQANYFLYNEIKTQTFFFTLTFCKTFFCFYTPKRPRLSSYTLHMFKDLLFPHFSQDYYVALCSILMEVEVFFKFFFSSPGFFEAGKGMDTTSLCSTGTWTKADLLLPKLVRLSDAQQLFGEAGFGLKAADFLGMVLPPRCCAALGPSHFVLG